MAKKTSKKGSTAEVILDIIQNVDPEDIKKGIDTIGAVAKGVSGLFKKKAKPVNVEDEGVGEFEEEEPL